MNCLFFLFSHTSHLLSILWTRFCKLLAASLFCKIYANQVKNQAWLTSKRFCNSFSGNIFVYLSIGIYIKFFGNIKIFYCSNNPVQEIANSLCDLKYSLRRLHVLYVMLSCCHEPLSSCCRMVRRSVIGRGVAVGKGWERESGQLHGFHSLTRDGSVLK